MNALFRNIRFYILLTSVFLSVAFYLFIVTTIQSPALQLIQLEELYGLTAVAYLYFALLAGPLCFTFRFLPFRGEFIKARRAIGVSAFYFSLLHAYINFFYQLGGFGGLWFLNSTYLFAISLSFIALIILFLMTATSFDSMIRKLTFPKWKLLHRFVYLASVFILIHVVLLGKHFRNLHEPIPIVFFSAVVFLLCLEANRFDAFLQKKFVSFPRFKITLITLIVAVVFFLVNSLL